MGNLKTERDGRRGRLAALLQRRLTDGARDERGVVAIIFALAIVVLVPLVLGLFDVYTATEQRSRLQDAMDAAALYAARSDLNTDAEINDLANKALTANLRLIRGATLISSEFHLADNATKVVGSAKIQPLALAPAFWNHPAVSASTEVVRNSKNLEVSLMLDVTGSMTTGTRIADLRAAAQQLVDIVVKDQQTPFYSKVAVVPWSMGVNLGSIATQARGATVGTNTITSISKWFAGNGSTPTQATISAITKGATTTVTTSSNHGFSTNDTVLITSITGSSNLTGLNNRYGTITKINNTQFTLNVDSSGFSNTYSGTSGRATKCVATDCTMTVTTAAAHGYANGTVVWVNGVSPSNLDNVLDGNTYSITGVTSTTYKIFAPTTMDAWTSGGTSYCTAYGCEYYLFTNGDTSGTRLFQASTCVSERTGTERYTDAAPSTAPVGFNYPAVDTQYSGATVANPCLGDEVIPLSTDKTTLKAKIGALQATGSTAGQIGTAWGWYMVSPNFGYLWPNASQRPAAYGQANTIKAVVLMTDGALNSPYCNGVIAKDAISGSGSIKDHENCNSTNGTTLAQSLALCAAMKASGKDVVVYTVGFQITGDTNAETLINTCATDSAHVYLPTSGAQLKDAFKAIGAELNNLRIAH